MARAGGFKLEQFDPEGLERAASALREINASPHAGQAMRLSMEQQRTRQMELQGEKAEVRPRPLWGPLWGRQRAALYGGPFRQVSRRLALLLPRARRRTTRRGRPARSS